MRDDQGRDWKVGDQFLLAHKRGMPDWKHKRGEVYILVDLRLKSSGSLELMSPVGTIDSSHVEKAMVTHRDWMPGDKFKLVEGARTAMLRNNRWTHTMETIYTVKRVVDGCVAAEENGDLLAFSWMEYVPPDLPIFHDKQYPTCSPKRATARRTVVQYQHDGLWITEDEGRLVEITEEQLNKGKILSARGLNWGQIMEAFKVLGK